MLIEQSWPNLAVAIGIGLLIGAERERRKGTGADRSPEGIRTFTIASILGAVSSIFNFWLLLASIICVTLFTVATRYHQKSEDPGITTEIALILTVILGGLSMRSPLCRLLLLSPLRYCSLPRSRCTDLCDAR